MTRDDKFRIIIRAFENRVENIVDIYDEGLREELGNISYKTLHRLIEDLKEECGCIEEIEGRKRKTYKLIDKIEVFKEILESRDYKKQYEGMNIVLEMVREGDPKLFRELEKKIKMDENIYLFKSSPFEDIENVTTDINFKKIVNHIRNRDYIKITIQERAGEKSFDNIRPIKLIFIDNNWYLAHIDEDKNLRLSRLNFIKKIEYGSKGSGFQIAPLKKYFKFLEKDLQNSLTLYGKEPKEAKIKVLPAVARYFKKDMKKFLSTQKFVEELEDGSVIFTLKYTQELEILPFVQKWLPDLVILEPQDLKEKYIEKLKQALNNQNF